eukprot:7216229-Prymnesium_polylepis.2
MSELAHTPQFVIGRLRRRAAVCCSVPRCASACRTVTRAGRGDWTGVLRGVGEGRPAVSRGPLAKLARATRRPRMPWPAVGRSARFLTSNHTVPSSRVVSEAGWIRR